MAKNNEKPIRFEVIRDWKQFDSLKGDWQDLLAQSDADNIFLTWEWIDCWRKTRKTAVKPLIITISNNDQIVAIAPFYIQSYRLLNLQHYKGLRCLGDQGSGSEYSNFIVKKANSAALKSMLWSYLLNEAIKPVWDFIWFTNVSSWTSGGETLLKTLADVDGLYCNARLVEFGQVDLDSLQLDILPALSKSLRTNIRQTSRRLDKLGPWKMEECTLGSELPKYLDKLFFLHNKHWQNLGGGTFQRRPELVDFYRCFVPLALQNGWLRLLRLESEGETQAMQLGYVYNNHFLAIQEGFNPDFLPGIGQVLRHFSYQSALHEGVSCYDFLGVYTDHKRRWLAEKKQGTNLFIWQSKVKNIPFKFKEIWPTGRFLKPNN